MTSALPVAAEMERQFNPRVSTLDFAEIARHRAERSARTRERLPFVPDVPYGDAWRSTVDVFPSTHRGPALVYIHGGYWRAGSAGVNSVVAEPFAARGAAVFLLNYGLCPTVPLRRIVSQVRSAVAWVRSHAAEYGGDADRLFLAGTSAGAHLAAMVLATDALVSGACLISGIYELRPVLSISVNAEIGLRAEDVADLSPMRHLPAGTPRLLLAAGSLEPPLWVQQTSDYGMRCRANGLACEEVLVPEKNHFSVVDALSDIGGPLSSRLTTMMFGPEKSS